MTQTQSELLARFRSFRQQVINELDRLEDVLISLGVPQQQPPKPDTQSDNWLTVAQVCEELHISDSTFYEWLREGLLPPGLQFGPRSKRWRMSDIEAWKNTRQKPDNGVEIPKKRRGRLSRIRKVKEFCYV